MNIYILLSDGVPNQSGFGVVFGGNNASITIS